MPACAAGGNNDALDRAQVLRAHIQAAKARRRILEIDAAAQRIFHCAWLLKDFFEHEMSELTALGFLGAKFELTDLDLSRVRAEVQHVEAIVSDGSDVIVVQVNHL